MSAPIEVLFSSDISGQLWNACVWDINTGTSLTSFKGESTSHQGLCILGNQYLLGASCTKPIIHVWALQRREQHQLKMICPGRVTALAASPDGTFCIAAVGEKIHLWQVCTGNLMSVMSRHYQTVNVLKFTDNGSHFISGGEDNLVVVWSLASVLSCLSNPTRKPEPVRVWSSHSLPVTDVHVGKGGARARVISSSLDQTCKVWDMVSGELLQTIVFPTSVMSVAMDATEYHLFAGGSNGNVYCVQMYGQPITTERHIESHEQKGTSCLKGHSKQVTCLTVSIDGTKLVSGSHDSTVKIWDVFSGQCVRTLQHKVISYNSRLIRFKNPMPLRYFESVLICEPTHLCHLLSLRPALQSLPSTFPLAVCSGGGMAMSNMALVHLVLQLTKRSPNRLEQDVVLTGQVTNTIIVPTPLAVISPEVKPTLPLQPFKRHLYTGEDNSENGGIFNVRIVGHLAENAKEEELINLHHEHLSETNMSSLKEELDQAKAVNKDIFSFTVNKILYNKIT